MAETKNNTVSKDKHKATLAYMMAATLGQLINKVNWWNGEYPNAPILKDDIVEIRKEDDSYMLLYYK